MKFLLYTITFLLFLSQNTYSQAPIKAFKAHKRSKKLNKAIFSPDSKHVLTCGRDSTAKLWDLEGNLIYKFKHNKDDVRAIAFSPNGKYIATGGTDKKAKIWNAKNGKLIQDLTFDASVYALAFSKDNQYLIVGQQNPYLKAIQVKSGKEFKSYKMRANYTRQISLSSDDKKLAAGYNTGFFYISFPEGKVIETFEDLKYEPDADYPRKVTNAIFSKDNSKLLTWYNGNYADPNVIKMKLWNLSDGSLAQKFKGLEGGFDAVFSPDGKYILTGGEHHDKEGLTKNNGNVNLWDIKKGKIIGHLEAFKYGISNLQFSPDGQYFLVTGRKARQVKIWKAKDILNMRNSYEGTSLVPKTKPQNSQKTRTNDDNNNNQTSEDNFVIKTTDTKYYALIISVQKYQDVGIPNLKHPEMDAANLKKVIQQYYTFEEENITFLKDPKRGDIINALDDLTRKVTDKDNMLIFYAGHGYWDKKLEQGYWLPTDAKIGYRANWLANSELVNYIHGIKSKHTLLITDACFGGSIFESTRGIEDAPKAIRNLYSRASRKAMTSGQKETVPDKSVFIEYLLKGLKENQETYLPAIRLHAFLQEPVLSNTNNAPEYRVIRNTKHEGGEFIFIKR